MKKVLIVVDMQNDFVYGILGSLKAQDAAKRIEDKLNTLSDDDIVIFTRDTHKGNYFETLEGEKLPVSHCLAGTGGWEIIDALKQNKHYTDRPKVDKNTFGCVYLPNTLYNCFGRSAFDESADIELEICGVCTDICVVSNALLLRAHFPNMKITVLKDLCAGTSPEAHEAALTVMKSCQIEVI